MNYSLGFLFSLDFKNVILIKKLRGVRVKGSLNGVGGLINSGDYPVDSMRREFRKETGFSVTDWGYFARITARDWDDLNIRHFIYCFVAVDREYTRCRSMTDEIVGIYSVADLMIGIVDSPIVPDLLWLLQMAIAQGKNGVGDGIEFAYVIEEDY